MLLAESRTEDVNALRWEMEAAGNRSLLPRVMVVLVMVAVVAAVAGLAYWDAERESTAALQDFAQEQSTLATALGAALRIRSSQGLPINERDVLMELRSIERARTLAIFLLRPGESVLRATDGRELASPRLIKASSEEQAVVRIPRDEAATLGLPPRTALRGISRIDAGRSGRCGTSSRSQARSESGIVSSGPAAGSC